MLATLDSWLLLGHLLAAMAWVGGVLVLQALATYVLRTGGADRARPRHRAGARARRLARAGERRLELRPDVAAGGARPVRRGDRRRRGLPGPRRDRRAARRRGGRR